jgi:hypothetical protein
VPYLATVFGPRFSVAEVTVLVGVPRGADYSGRQARIEARLSVLTWMMGANIAMTLVVLLRVFH